MCGKNLERRSFIQAILAGAVTIMAWGAQSPKPSLEEAVKLLEASVQSGALRAVSLHVRCRSFSFRRAVGEASPETVFLIASITKPLTAAGMMLLADRREMQLSDPVQKFIPEFNQGNRKLIAIRHLLTHTSGLPDQLPENVELRKRHAGG